MVAFEICLKGVACMHTHIHTHTHTHTHTPKAHSSMNIMMMNMVNIRAGTVYSWFLTIII